MAEKRKWHKTKYPGVRYREHTTRKHGVQYDRYFVINYKLNGKLKNEAVGWASDGWTAEKAHQERAELRKAHRTGEGPVTLKEKRDAEQARREKKEQEKKRSEIEKTPVKLFFENIYKPISKTNKKDETYRKEKELFKNWIEPVIGNVQLNELSPFHLEKVKKRMVNAGRAPRTIQYAFALIRQVWNAARRYDYVNTESPTKQVTLPRIDNARQRFLTPDEAQKLLEEVKRRSSQLYKMSLLALHCGLRAGEIFNLKYADIDIERGLLTIQSPKGSKSRAAFMTEEVKNIFKQETFGKPSEYVFKNRKGKKVESVSNAFDRAVEKTGLNNNIEDPKQRVVFHTLRHTYASWLVESGVDLYTVQKLMGHSNFKMTERYAHLGENTLQAAVKTLEKRINKKSKKANIRK